MSARAKQPTVHREPLLELLGAYRPSHEEDRAACERMRAFVGRHAECFERTLTVGHVTGSAWIVDHERTHCLLTHHRKLDRWLQLGGHADGDSDIERVAMREAVEESGLDTLELVSREVFDIDVHRIPARPGEPAHDHHDVRFLLAADRHRPLIVSAESKELAWVPLERVAGLGADVSVLRLIEKTPQL